MGQLFKNVASQKVRVFAFADAGHASLDPGEPVTGDAANISAYTAVDNGTLGASNDAAPTEVDATNAPGYYEFDPTQGETNGDVVEWYPKSSTAGVQVVTVGGSVQTTQPQYLPDLGIESDGDLTKVNTLDGHTPQTADHTAGIADIPTVAEFNARTLPAASYFDPAADTVANVTTVGTLTGHTPQTGDTYALANGATGFAAIDTVVDSIFALFTGITSVAQWLGLIAGKQTGNSTARTEIRATGAGSGAFDETTDSLEALRDRGDAAWITGGGGAITQALNVQLVLPTSIDLAGTATVRLGMMLLNSLDDLPSTAEIAPGTISIERKALGGTSWSAIVTDDAMSEQAGMVYYDEVFDSGTGYAEGDSIRVTFKSVSITADANTHEVCDANGVVFQTEIRQTMRGTDGANTTTPPTAAANADAVWDEAQAGHTSAGTFGKYLDTEVSGVGGGGGGTTQREIKGAVSGSGTTVYLKFHLVEDGILASDGDLSSPAVVGVYGHDGTDLGFTPSAGPTIVAPGIVHATGTITSPTVNQAVSAKVQVTHGGSARDGMIHGVVLAA